MEAVDGANVNAVGIFTFNTVLGDYKGHIGYQLMLIKIAYLKWTNHIRKQVLNESLEMINTFYKISRILCLKKAFPSLSGFADLRDKGVWYA